MGSTWVLGLAKKLIGGMLQSIKISKSDIEKIVDYADKDENGMVDGLEFFELLMEYRSIKK